MKNYYYIIWIPWIKACITKAKNNDDWKTQAWILMSGLNAINYATIAMLLDWLGLPLMWAHFKIFGYYRFDGALNGFLNFAMPVFFIISYFSLFYKDRYKHLLPKYEKINGKIIGISYIISTFALIILVLIIKQTCK